MSPERKIVWLCLCGVSDEKPACHPDEAVRVYEDTIRRGLIGVFALTVTDEEGTEQ